MEALGARISFKKDVCIGLKLWTVPGKMQMWRRLLWAAEMAQSPPGRKARVEGVRSGAEEVRILGPPQKGGGKGSTGQLRCSLDWGET